VSVGTEFGVNFYSQWVLVPSKSPVTVFFAAINYLSSRPAQVFGAKDPLNNSLLGAPPTLYIAQNTGKPANT
jgi:hypothetical protein